MLSELRKRIAGNTDVLELMFVSIVANGHIMLEGVPGLAKTTMAKALSDTIQAEFKRIQGTPDIAIGDIVGYTFLDQSGNTQLKRGPIFTNMLLIDELNRIPPKTTTALLECLEEREVTIGNSTIPLKNPFITIATQNPLNIEGTTQLPKVLADRFLMRIAVSYTSMEEEEQMLRIKESEDSQPPRRVLSTSDILSMQEQAKSVAMPDDVVKYITEVVGATRTDIHIVMGGSPRAEISFMKAAKARALVEGRKTVTIEDIKYLAKPVLGHRILVKSTGGLGVNGVIDGIIATLH